jgi:acyl-CoA synthetase (AMP-forming)/AMP-acid ligase II
LKVNEIGYPGACGYIPVLNRYTGILPVFIIKIDKDMNPIRDKHGYCIQSDIGEKGLLVAVIGQSILTDFCGYAHQAEKSNRKIIDNLFKKNQRAFNTGDCVVMDYYGYIYFVDRLGDTFRWKGENVSTIEVENVLSSFINSKEVVVYGVEVPGQEGRAGMAILITDSIDAKKLSDYVQKNLPFYAKPLFIRVGQVEHTGKIIFKLEFILNYYFRIWLIKKKEHSKLKNQN